MNLTMTNRGAGLTPALRELAERRVLFALARFDPRISLVELVVTDENGPRGGVDKSCRISVVLEWGTEVVVTDRDADLATCISRAAERIGRSVARAVEKRQQLDRTRINGAATARLD